MKMAAIAVFGLLASGTAFSRMPPLNFECPDGIKVQTNDGGPVFINGRIASLKKISDDSYDAILEKVTISIVRNPDQSWSASYAGPKGAKGVCKNLSDNDKPQ